MSIFVFFTVDLSIEIRVRKETHQIDFICYNFIELYSVFSRKMNCDPIDITLYYIFCGALTLWVDSLNGYELSSKLVEFRVLQRVFHRPIW